MFIISFANITWSSYFNYEIVHVFPYRHKNDVVRYTWVLINDVNTWGTDKVNSSCCCTRGDEYPEKLLSQWIIPLGGKEEKVINEWQSWVDWLRQTVMSLPLQDQTLNIIVSFPPTFYVFYSDWEWKRAEKGNCKGSALILDSAALASACVCPIETIEVKFYKCTNFH